MLEQHISDEHPLILEFASLRAAITKYQVMCLSFEAAFCQSYLQCAQSANTQAVLLPA